MFIVCIHDDGDMMDETQHREMNRSERYPSWVGQNDCAEATASPRSIGDDQDDQDDNNDSYSDGSPPAAFEKILLQFDDEHLFGHYLNDTEHTFHIKDVYMDKRSTITTSINTIQNLVADASDSASFA